GEHLFDRDELPFIDGVVINEAVPSVIVLKEQFSGSGNIHRAEYKRRTGSCLGIERLCRDAHANGVLMFKQR
ncbi:hypothetical protein AB7W18_22640, partial [Providencia rettgeri]